jgi:hypothetical protein
MGEIRRFVREESVFRTWITVDGTPEVAVSRPNLVDTIFRFRLPVLGHIAP